MVSSAVWSKAPAARKYVCFVHQFFRAALQVFLTKNTDLYSRLLKNCVVSYQHYNNERFSQQSFPNMHREQACNTFETSYSADLVDTEYGLSVIRYHISFVAFSITYPFIRHGCFYLTLPRIYFLSVPLSSPKILNLLSSFFKKILVFPEKRKIFL